MVSYYEDEVLQIVDFLISSYILIDDDFWEPVRVGLTFSQIKNFETVHERIECPICMDTKEKSRKLPCCAKTTCFTCTRKWFKSSVKCPFCVRDLRETASQVHNEKEEESTRAQGAGLEGVSR